MKKIFFLVLFFLVKESVFAQVSQTYSVETYEATPRDSSRSALKDLVVMTRSLLMPHPDSIIKTKEGIILVYGNFQKTISKEQYLQCLDRWIQDKEDELRRKSNPQYPQSFYPQYWGSPNQQQGPTGTNGYRP